MTQFTIDSDNTITACLAGDAIPKEHARFASEKEFLKLAAGWPVSRLIEIWNGFAGAPPFGDLKPVRKFMDRKAAVARIWRAIQILAPAVAPKTTEAASASATRDDSKKAVVLDLLRRAGGVTLSEIMTATQWQAHTVRGFISTIQKKQGITIESFRRDDGERCYRFVA